MNTLTNDDLIKHYNTYSKMIYRLAFIQMKTLYALEYPVLDSY